MHELKKTYDSARFSLTEVKAPSIVFNAQPPVLKQETLVERKEKLLQAMKNKGLDTVFVYADREHAGNFEYLTGFIPRFEEGLLEVTAEGEACLFLGNENLKMANHSRLPASLVHVPHFSLPNQPMDNTKSFKAILSEETDLKGKKIGIVGWKRFTSSFDDNRQLYDVPYFIVEALLSLAKEQDATVVSAAELFIGEHDGVRTTNNADEVHYYEYGSNLASNGVLEAMDQIEIGKTETEIASYLSRYGQPHNITTICATGDRFTDAVIYPRDKAVALGDKFSITTGYKGGLTSRAGYIANETADLPAEVEDYLERVAIPYYAATVTWMENIRIGMTGGALYDMIESVLPKETYGWHLNPGHLAADEEWMSSPVYPNSTAELKSGMLFQVDIIPSVPHYGGASAETGIALADEELRNEIKEHYPALWERFEKRRNYMKEELNIQLPPELLPLSDTVGYYRPYFLNKEKALKFTRSVNQ